MTPIERAAAVYAREPCARPFHEDLTAHFVRGYVISTPDVFVMFRPVRWANGEASIVNPWIPHEDCDAWHIYLFSGNIEALESLLPYPLPWVSYERENVLRRFRVSRMSGLVKFMKKALTRE